MSYVEAGGVNTWYAEYGTGRPLVLLHGAFADVSELGATIPALAGLAAGGHDDFRQVGAGGLEPGEQRGARALDDGDPGRRVTQHVTGVVAAGRRVERDEDAAAGG